MEETRTFSKRGVLVSTLKRFLIKDIIDIVQNYYSEYDGKFELSKNSSIGAFSEIVLMEDISMLAVFTSFEVLLFDSLKFEILQTIPMRTENNTYSSFLYLQHGRILISGNCLFDASLRKILWKHKEENQRNVVILEDGRRFVRPRILEPRGNQAKFVLDVCAIETGEIAFSIDLENFYNEQLTRVGENRILIETLKGSILLNIDSATHTYQLKNQNRTAKYLGNIKGRSAVLVRELVVEREKIPRVIKNEVYRKDIHTNESLGSILCVSEIILNMLLSSDNRYIAIVTLSETLFIYDNQKERFVFESAKLKGDFPRKYLFSENGSLFVISEKFLEIYDFDTERIESHVINFEFPHSVKVSKHGIFLTHPGMLKRLR